jgi:CheY-like chemotaxis protein
MSLSGGRRRQPLPVSGLETPPSPNSLNPLVDPPHTGDGIAASAGPKPESPPRILVVDDERLIADTLVHILNLSGFVATAVYSGDDALAALPRDRPDIVLSDVKMPGRNGVETGILIRKRCPDIRIVLFSGQAGVDDVHESIQRHGFELWRKPIHPQELVRRLRAN